MSCAVSRLALRRLACAFPNWPQMENILLKLDGFLSVALRSQLKATTKHNNNNNNRKSAEQNAFDSVVCTPPRHPTWLNASCFGQLGFF